MKYSAHAINSMKTISTIWVPSSIMRDRVRMQLTNCITAIPKTVLELTLENLASESEIRDSKDPNSEVLEVISDPRLERLRRYEIEVELMNTRRGLID